MKNCFTLFMSFIVLATSSCSDKATEQIADMIVVSRSSVAFSEQGGSTTIAVASPSAWSADCADKWVALNSKEGQLTISVDNNATGDIRSSTVILSSGSDERRVALHQAYSRSTVQLQISVPESVKFDSEGDKCIFTVHTNGQWEVTSQAEWLSIVGNQENSTVTITANKNVDKGRTATLLVRATDGATTAQREVTITQISREENPYFKILGSYGLYAQNWFYDGKSLGVGGTGAFCTIVENEYNKSFFIHDLFLKGTIIEASFNKFTGTVTIELGRRCFIRQMAPGQQRSYYIMSTDVNAKKFQAATITASLGTGKDDSGTERKALILAGFPADRNGMGLICSDTPQQYAYISDLFYAAGSMYLVENDAASGQSSSITAHTGATPDATFPASNN